MNVSTSRARLGPAGPAAAALCIAALTTACRGDEIENLVAKVPWFTTMRDQPAVGALEEQPRTPPPGTVTIDAGLPAMTTPEGYAGIPNPIEATPESLARGEELFNTFCSVCHGPQGRGGGNVEGPFPAGLINRLDTPRAIGRTDGYLFGMISTGRGLMPDYRRIPQEDRWHMVNYVRQLQSLPQ